MGIWTVIGYYEDNGQSFAEGYEAQNGMQALRAAALAHGTLTLVCAVEGDHKEPGTLEFAGTAVVDAETYLELFKEDGAPLDPDTVDAP